MNLFLLLRKIVNTPLIPVRGTWIDAAIFVVIFAILSVAAGTCFWGRSPRLRQNTRFITRIVSLCVFAFMFFRCICLLKTSVVGMTQIGWDDVAAFGNFFLFVLIGSFVLVAGNIYCGWMCPLGFLQEISARLFPVKTKRFRFLLLGIIFVFGSVLLFLFRPANDFFTENIIALWSLALVIVVTAVLLNPAWERVLLKTKYAFLVLYILLTGAGVWFSEAWCWLTGNDIDYSSIVGFCVIFLVSSVIPLAWCRYVCPTGTFLFFLGRKSIVKIKEPGSCFSMENTACKGCCMGERSRIPAFRFMCVRCGSCNYELNDKKN